MVQPPSRSGRRVWEAPKLPSSGRTSLLGLAGTDGDRSRVTLQLDQVADAVRDQPQNLGRQHSGHGDLHLEGYTKAVTDDPDCVT